MAHAECHEDGFCGACIQEEKEALMEQRDAAYRKLDAANLQLREFREFLVASHYAMQEPGKESHYVLARNIAKLLNEKYPEKRI